MKRVVKISEKKLINFIKKSLNEYNNKMINKTNIVLNEQDNNDEWTQVDDEREFDSLKEQGIFEFKKGASPNLAAKTTNFTENANIHTYYRKIVTPKEKARQKSIEDAWEAVQIYGQENGLRERAKFDSDGNEINYYLINGIKYYNDGFKKDGNDRERYSKDDDIFENSPDDKINWTKKFPCIENYADENDGERDSKTNYYTIKNVIYKPTGKKSSDGGQNWVDFYCSDAELKKYIEPVKVTEPVKVNPQEKIDIQEPIINKYRF
jgi:hypothetical protein